MTWRLRLLALATTVGSLLALALAAGADWIDR
jgi:hypothetical protein